MFLEWNDIRNELTLIKNQYEKLQKNIQKRNTLMTDSNASIHKIPSPTKVNMTGPLGSASSVSYLFSNSISVL